MHTMLHPEEQLCHQVSEIIKYRLERLIRCQKNVFHSTYEALLYSNRKDLGNENIPDKWKVRL